MTIKAGTMECVLYKSAFSGEVVFAVQTENDLYEGVAPRHYAHFEGVLSDQPQKGSLRVRVIKNGGDKATVATPDGEVILIPATAVQY